jgi:hypothetical protein
VDTVALDPLVDIRAVELDRTVLRINPGDPIAKYPLRIIGVIVCSNIEADVRFRIGLPF